MKVVPYLLLAILKVSCSYLVTVTKGMIMNELNFKTSPRKNYYPFKITGDILKKFGWKMLNRNSGNEIDEPRNQQTDFTLANVKNFKADFSIDNKKRIVFSRN